MNLINDIKGGETMDCPYYDLSTYRCKLTGEYVYDSMKHDYYCFEPKYSYEQCQTYKDWVNKGMPSY